MSDIDALDTDSYRKGRKKKQGERKAGHAVKTMLQEEVYRLNTIVHKTVVEKQSMPTEGLLLGDMGILTQREIKELSNIALGNAPSTAQAMQLWEVQPKPMGLGQRVVEEQHDLLDFLKVEQPSGGTKPDRAQSWMALNPQYQAQGAYTE